MSDSDNKKIACIFEEEQVFLTKSGKFYGYEKVAGNFKCHRMNNIEINRFLYRMRDNKEIMFLSSVKQAKKPLPRKYEDFATLE